MSSRNFASALCLESGMTPSPPSRFITLHSAAACLAASRLALLAQHPHSPWKVNSMDFQMFTVLYVQLLNLYHSETLELKQVWFIWDMNLHTYNMYLQGKR